MGNGRDDSERDTVAPLLLMQLPFLTAWALRGVEPRWIAPLGIVAAGALLVARLLHPARARTDPDARARRIARALLLAAWVPFWLRLIEYEWFRDDTAATGGLVAALVFPLAVHLLLGNARLIGGRGGGPGVRTPSP